MDGGALPLDENGAIDEDMLHGMDLLHIEDVERGETKRGAVQLEAGTYLLVCNPVDELGDAHFAEGMVATFTVT